MLHVKKLIQKGESIKDHPFFVVKTMVILWSFKNVFLMTINRYLSHSSNHNKNLDQRQGLVLKQSLLFAYVDEMQLIDASPLLLL